MVCLFPKGDVYQDGEGTTVSNNSLGGCVPVFLGQQATGIVNYAVAMIDSLSSYSQPHPSRADSQTISLKN